MFRMLIFLFSNMKRLSVKQHLRASQKSIENCKKLWQHRFYILILVLFAIRFLLVSALFLTQSGSKTQMFIISLNTLEYDATVSLLTTSISYFRNGFTLFSITLVVSTFLTVDWQLSTKYDSLLFRQSYDMLVVNKEHFFLLYGRQQGFYLTMDTLLALNSRIIMNHFKKLRDIWRGRLLLTFATPLLRHFDPTTCTRAVRGRALFYALFCEVVTTAHVNATSMYSCLPKVLLINDVLFVLQYSGLWLFS